MADIQVANTDDDLSANTLLTAERPYTITGLHTYNRGSSPPFAVASGAAQVDNLDADKLDGVEGAEFLKRDGTVALTTNWDAGGYEIRSNTFESDVATGTAPLTIASTTLVTNLNADILDGQQGSYYLAAANATGTLSVAQGGTGATSLTDGGLLLGSGTGALTALGVAANGQIPIGDGSGDPQLATISGTSNQIDVTNGAASITLSLSSSYVGQTSITTLGTIGTGTWEGTDVAVAHGGTGASSLTDGGILLGSGTGAITALGVATNGQIPIGDGSGDPVLATISGTSNQVDVTNGAGSITLSLSSSYVGQTSITTLGTIATGTWEGTDVAVAHGGTGASSLTNTAILMGKGTSAVTPAHGIYGYDSYAILNHQGAGAAVYLTDTNSTRQLQITHQQNTGTTSILKMYGSAAAYGTGNNLTYLDTGTGEQTSLASGNNIKLTNFAGTEHMRLGPDGISFNGGTDDMDYEVGSYTAKLYGSTTGDSTHVVTATNYYVRVGKLVFVHINFANATCPASATGVRTISLPFANYASTGGGAFLQSNVTITGARTWTNAYFYASTILCYSSGDDVGWDDESIENDAGDSVWIQGSFSYRTT